MSALIMGVVNVTPDSFSDGGRYTDAKTLFDYAAGLTEGGTASIDTSGGSGEEGAEEAPSEDQNE